METTVDQKTDQLTKLGEHWKSFFQFTCKPLDALHMLTQAISEEDQRENFRQTLAHIAQNMYFAAKEIEEGNIKDAGSQISYLFEIYTMNHLGEVFTFNMKSDNVLTDYHQTMFFIYDCLNDSDKILTGQFRST